MEDVKFVIKCLAVTALLIVLMQIRVGQHTIEGHAVAWVHHSSISQHLQDVAEGAVRVSKEAKNGITRLVGGTVTPDESSTTQASSQAAAGGGWFKIKRSAAYYRQKEREQQKARERDVKAGESEVDDSAASDDGIDRE